MQEKRDTQIEKNEEVIARLSGQMSVASESEKKALNSK